MKNWTLTNDYSLIYITSPAKEKGQVFLKRKKEMWNWVPNIERMIKIPPSMMMQSWMGSDFTNDDLINQSSIVVDYQHSYVREDSFDNDEVWVIDAVAKPDAPVVWSKVTLSQERIASGVQLVERGDGVPEDLLACHAR